MYSRWSTRQRQDISGRVTTKKVSNAQKLVAGLVDDLHTRFQFKKSGRCFFFFLRAAAAAAVAWALHQMFRSGQHK